MRSSDRRRFPVNIFPNAAAQAPRIGCIKRNKPKKMDALISITVVNRVARSKAANVSSIEFKLEIYRHVKKKPVAVVDISWAKGSPMKSGCLGPWMMRILLENVAKPAKDLGRQIRLGLKGKKIKRKSATASKSPFFLLPVFAIYHLLKSKFGRVSCSI